MLTFDLQILSKILIQFKTADSCIAEHAHITDALNLVISAEVLRVSEYQHMNERAECTAEYPKAFWASVSGWVLAPELLFIHGEDLSGAPMDVSFHVI